MMAGRQVGTEDYHGRKRVQTVNNEDSKTVQSDAHLADIKNIMAQYAETGMESLDETELTFADVSTFTDLGDALRQAAVANEQFMKLPSKVREIFDHDVAVWLDTAHDDDKRNALIQGGFLKGPEPKEEPPKKEVKAGTKVAGEGGTPEAKGDPVAEPAE